VLLGHERHGVAEDVWQLVDEVVEIPMIGTGSSLNVAVAGSLVPYRLAGMLRADLGTGMKIGSPADLPAPTRSYRPSGTFVLDVAPHSRHS
jgi:tRNA C32,U32 (ribose-2'-O)-methylase TrmJ